MTASLSAIAGLVAAAVVASGEPPVLPVGPDAYTMWDHWAYQRIGQRAYMRSTYDRSGGNMDPSNFLYQLSDTYNTTLDVEGPGILYFVRTNHWHGSPWHYTVDGLDHIVSESSTADPLHPVAHSTFIPERLFPSPVALTWSETKGADLSWVPITFGKSLRLAYSRTYYGTGYYIYDQFVGGARLSRPLDPWDGNTPPDPAISQLLSRAGNDIAPRPGSPGVREDSGRVSLSGTAPVPVWNSAGGPRTVRALEFSVPRSDALAFSGVRLRVTWDDRPWASIDAPIAQFFGAGILYDRDAREYLVKSLPMVVRFGRDRVTLSCYFPMPYFHSARIALVGADREAFPDIGWSVRTEPFAGSPNEVGYFHATYRDHPGPPSDSPRAGEDLVLLDTRAAEGGGNWSGQFVGTSIIFSHEADLGTLEGDPRFFFDDSLTPQAQGTGTEEWCGGGDYWGGENMTIALAGHPVGAKSRAKAVGPEDRIESAYRFLLADLMPFGRNALIRLEHGGVDESVQHYETVAYWYGLPAASLVPTDTLSIGDSASESEHGYVSSEASKPYELTSRYEWGPDSLGGREIYPATTDRGRITRGSSEFTMSLDPDNLGVLLRRKLDYSYPGQRAEVSVGDAAPARPDWKAAGIWYLAGSNRTVFSFGGGRVVHGSLEGVRGELGPTTHFAQTSNRRFRDDEFLIPSDLTRGRSSIRIRIKFTPVAIPLFPGSPLPELAWSEMRYTAYCFVEPRLREAGDHR